MRSGDDYNKGLYNKFKVERTDGQSAPGKKHARCRYFVIDVDHDQFSPVALQAYASACREQFPKLAADIDRLLRGENMFDDWRPEGV